MAIEFRCVQCQKLLQTPDETAGKQAKCPECGTIQPIPGPGPVAAGPPPIVGEGSPFAPGASNPEQAGPPPPGGPPGPENPYQSPRDYTSGPVPWSDSSYLRAYALDRVSPPANILIAYAVVGLVLQTLGLVANLLSMAKPNAFGGNPNLNVEIFSGGVVITMGLFGMAATVIVLIGALKMKRLESHGWATAGAVCAVLPCVSWCCFLGIPFGVWALVVLNDPVVKSAFLNYSYAPQVMGPFATRVPPNAGGDADSASPPSQNPPT
jgi:hypothetical protein